MIDRPPLFIPQTVYYMAVELAINDLNNNFQLKDGELYWMGVRCVPVKPYNIL